MFRAITIGPLTITVSLQHDFFDPSIGAVAAKISGTLKQGWLLALLAVLFIGLLLAGSLTV